MRLLVKKWIRDFICDELTGCGFGTSGALVGWFIIPSRHLNSTLFLISIFQRYLSSWLFGGLAFTSWLFSQRKLRNSEKVVN